MKTCPTCGKLFDETKVKLSHNGINYCTIKCLSKDMIDRTKRKSK